MRRLRHLLLIPCSAALLLAACQAGDLGPDPSPGLRTQPLLTVCSSGDNGCGAISGPVDVTVNTATANYEQFQICKYGSSAGFTYSVHNNNTGGDFNDTASLNDGQCQIIAALGGAGGNVTVAETSVQSGFKLDSVRVTTVAGSDCVNPPGATPSTTRQTTASVTGTEKGSTGDGICRGVLVEYFNSAIPPAGCSFTIGYWKTHAGFGPQADVVTPLLPILLGTGGGKSINVTTAALAVQLLSFKGSNNVFDASNGINKLYAQLLGAKLNIKNGADGSSVASTIAAADAFLTTHNSTDWSSLTNTQKQTVLGWATTLDNYNNGLLGPVHCEF